MSLERCHVGKQFHPMIDAESTREYYLCRYRPHDIGADLYGIGKYIQHEGLNKRVMVIFIPPEIDGSDINRMQFALFDAFHRHNRIGFVLVDAGVASHFVVEEKTKANDKLKAQLIAQLKAVDETNVVWTVGHGVQILSDENYDALMPELRSLYEWIGNY